MPWGGRHYQHSRGVPNREIKGWHQKGVVGPEETNISVQMAGSAHSGSTFCSNVYVYMYSAPGIGCSIHTRPPLWGCAFAFMNESCCMRTSDPLLFKLGYRVKKSNSRFSSSVAVSRTLELLCMHHLQPWLSSRCRGLTGEKRLRSVHTEAATRVPSLSWKGASL